MAEPIREVTIVGGGTAGWLAALLLQKGMPQGRKAKITLIESPNVPTVGVGEATVPNMPRTLKDAGLSERKFFKTCNASFKLGVDFVDWNRDSAGKPISYINPFALPPSFGRMELGVYYNDIGAGNLDFVQTFAPTVDLIRACKAPRLPGAGDFDQTLKVGFAYHLDAGKFAKLMQETCVAAGVRHVPDDVQEVELDDNGYVAALQLERSGRHPVELVIDCTGFRGLIINKALGEPFVSYSNYLANDRAMALQIPHPDPQKLEPVTRSTALGNGWSWRVPLYNRIGTGYVYSSAHVSDDAAREDFLRHLGPAHKDAEPRVIPMRVGRTRNAWVKNCVALGLAGGFIEPLESTAIHMVDLGVRWLVTYFPDSDFAPALRDQYNRLTDKLYDEVRDFICLHYALSNRTDTQYWIDAREALEVPERLAELLEVWRYALPGQYDLPFASLFDHTTYQAVLLGKRVYETGYGRGDLARGARLDRAKWKAYVQQLRGQVKQTVQAASDHRAYLAQVRGEMAPAGAASGAASGAGTAGAFQMPTATVAMPGTPMGQLPRVPAAPKKLDEEDASLL
ncbi:tryptophan 7-halogenase [Psychromarinibacter sp. C21-152]|uniref:Tryptophan 7-halogenase n=1 Tax=Psychromarinibacter sediminicola TaxID=3033385 RepID=A0AAE3NRP5_9RHOB|nr:tryptophan halogenase family protein [Psychromarinibacter sediminicola]MDF0600781.1 tryptophan 7-halogenase [Psychromarinibacter sediminicola]